MRPLTYLNLKSGSSGEPENGFERFLFGLSRQALAGSGNPADE
jgi:hypothetical protein